MIVNPSLGSGALGLTGTTDQVVGFDASGKPTPVSKEELRGPQGIKGDTGATGARGPQGPAGPGMPSGAIIMWSGSVSTIPAGWVLCNGSNGTPDLRNRFIVGAGSSYSVGAKGGSDTVTLTVAQLASHSHPVSSSIGVRVKADSLNGEWVFEVDNTNTANSLSTGGSQPHENRPPYYALCFIMKQ